MPLRKTSDATVGEIQVVRLDLLTMLPDVQSRVRLDRSTVETYAQRYRDYPEEDDVFPPIVVYLINGTYVVADGFHRVEAAKCAGRLSLRARVLPGTVHDAWWAGVHNNKTHGLAYNAGDKTKIVETILAHPRDAKLSARDIAKLTGISRQLVDRIRNRKKLVLLDEVATVATSADGRLTSEQQHRMLTRAQQRIQDSAALMVGVAEEMSEARGMLKPLIEAVREAVARLHEGIELLTTDEDATD